MPQSNWIVDWKKKRKSRYRPESVYTLSILTTPEIPKVDQLTFTAAVPQWFKYVEQKEKSQMIDLSMHQIYVLCLYAINSTFPESFRVK